MQSQPAAAGVSGASSASSAAGTSNVKPTKLAIASASSQSLGSSATEKDSSPPGLEQAADATAAAAYSQGTVQPLALETTSGWTEEGIASWYGPRFQGKRTANGERFDPHELTAAHKTLPFGTRVRVKSMVNGKEVIVRINDRGPFIKDRIIDLSQAAAQAIGLLGVKRVEIARLK